MRILFLLMISLFLSEASLTSAENILTTKEGASADFSENNSLFDYSFNSPCHARAKKHCKNKNQGPTGPRGPRGKPGTTFIPSFGSWFMILSDTIPPNTIDPVPLHFNQIENQQGITIQNSNTEFLIHNDGFYLINWTINAINGNPTTLDSIQVKLFRGINQIFNNQQTVNGTFNITTMSGTFQSHFISGDTISLRVLFDSSGTIGINIFNISLNITQIAP